MSDGPLYLGFDLSTQQLKGEQDPNVHITTSPRPRSVKAKFVLTY